MALRDFIKPKNSNTELNEDEFREKVITTFEKNVELYKGKSLTWNVRITADELKIGKDELCEILDEHYGSQEKAED